MSMIPFISIISAAAGSSGQPASSDVDPRCSTPPNARPRPATRPRPCLAIAFACAFGMLPAAADAEIIPAYFGWNYVADATAPPVMALTSFSYFSGSASLEVMNIPSFSGYTGMPDGVGLSDTPTYTTRPLGDGETTRTIHMTLPVDWAPSGTATPWGIFNYPTIAIVSFTTADSLGNPFGNYGGFASDWYIVGLIQNGPTGFGPPYVPPLPPNEELYSTLPIYQGDVYNNPQGIAVNQNGPDDLTTVIFSATIPEPASLAVLGLGLASLGILSRKHR